MKNYFTNNFSNVEVTGEQYPLSPMKKMFSNMIMAIQIAIVGIIVAPDFVKSKVTFIPGEIVDLISQNKIIAGVGAFFGGNIINSIISNSGALEIFYNDKLIWSKLQSGNVPNVQGLVQLIKQHGGVLAKK
jgi:selT/selW/selH-like putative selenoprotein